MQIREGIHDGFEGEVELRTMKRGFPLEKMRKQERRETTMEIQNYKILIKQKLEILSSGN